jgi:hypothetical protein
MDSIKFDFLLQRIGKALGKLRDEKGFRTMKEFALQHELPVIQYWRIENGKTNLTINTLLLLLAIHDVDLQQFFILVRNQAEL